jgi:hypothetical protein
MTSPVALELVSLRPVRVLVARAATGAAFPVVSGVALFRTLPRIHWLPLELTALVLWVALGYVSALVAWDTVRALFRHRAARRCLSLVAHPLPEGWRGPYLTDAKVGAVAYGIDYDEDGAPIPTEVLNLLQRPSPDGVLLMAFVHVPGSGEPVPDARCRALLRQLLETDWMAVGPTLACGTIFGCWARSAQRPFALERAIESSEPPPWPTFTRATEVPAPIAFPREPFAAELARHEGLVRANLDGLAFLARETSGSELEPFALVGGRVGEIIERGGKLVGPRVYYGRACAAHHYQNVLGVRHALQVPPGRHRLHVIVRTDDLVSLHVARVHEAPVGKTGVARSLVLESPSVVFEPVRQEHARRGGRTTVYWQSARGAVVHAAFTTAPETECSAAEAADRLFALRTERMTRAVWGGGAHHRLAEGFLWYYDSPSSGERASAIDFPFAEMCEIVHGYSAIKSAIAAHRAYGDWYPVVIDSRRHGSLRWLPMRAGLEESPRPDPVDEARRGGDLYLVEDDCG